MIIIIIAVILLVSTLLYTEHPSVRALKDAGSLLGVIDSEMTLIGMTDIRSTDHRRGNENSALLLIEYSDFTCLMCGAMQENFERMVREENILVISRHLFPHGSGVSLERATAAECVAKHVDEDAFFAFAEYLYTHRGEKDITQADLENKAVLLGADAEIYRRCLTADTSVRDRILKDSEEGWRLGARGTPYIVVVYNGVPIGISYANEYGRFLGTMYGLSLLWRERGEDHSG